MDNMLVITGFSVKADRFFCVLTAQSRHHLPVSGLHRSSHRKGHFKEH